MKAETDDFIPSGCHILQILVQSCSTAALMGVLICLNTLKLLKKCYFARRNIETWCKLMPAQMRRGRRNQLESKQMHKEENKKRDL